MKKPVILSLSLMLLGLSVLVSCTSCSQQPVTPKPNPEEPLRLLWSYEFSQQVDGLSSVTLRPEIIDASSVIVGLDRQFTKLSQDNGAVVWQAKIPDNKPNYINILNHDHRFIYGKNHDSRTYFAIDLRNGSLAWQKQNPAGMFYQYPRDDNNENHIYLSGEAPEIYVFSKEGKYEKTIQLQERGRAINATNNNIFIKQGWKPDSSESAYGRIVSLDAQTHRRNWQYETTRGGFYYADLILKDGVLYSGTTSGPSVFVALNAATGQVKWEKPGLMCWRFTLAGGALYINDGAGITALDATTGNQLWRYGYGSHGEANVAYLDGYVYHAHNGVLHVIDAQTGQLAAGPIKSPDGSGFYNLNASGGKVFVQSDFHLYCYQAYKGE